MPPVLSPTFLAKVEKAHYNQLTQQFIDQDTAITGGGYYQLPKTWLLILHLWTGSGMGSFKWTTVRPWNADKEKYYRSLCGQEVQIVIDEGGDKG